MVGCQERDPSLKPPPFKAAQIGALGFECQELKGDLWVWPGRLPLPQSHLQAKQSPCLNLGSGIPGGKGPYP